MINSWTGKITKKDLPNLKKAFMEVRDPIGFNFAESHLGGFDQLERLHKFVWFKREWDKWQKELRASIKAEALKRIQEIASEGSTQSLAAAKYLANGEYLDEASSKRGRPTKEEVTGELKRQVKAIEIRNEDYNRMTGLTVVQGGKK